MDPLTITLTIFGTAIGTLFGVHLGRRFYGLSSRWEGWQAEIDWLVTMLRRQ